MVNSKVSRFAYAFFSLFIIAEDGECAESKLTKTRSHGMEVHWGYEGVVGPDAWGTLCPEFVLCSEGEFQSPIDISETTAAHLSDIEFNYKPTTLNIVNNGHTIQVNYDEGSHIEINGSQQYQLKQFHFHAPSEHTIGGKHAEIEMHLVHQNAEDELAVVGLLIERGSHRWSFRPMWDNMPENSGDRLHAKNVTVNAENLIPGNRLYYKYGGSLTTPPCSEGVKWFVLATPVEMSGAQIDSFKAIVYGNNRPVQPLNNRELHMDASLD